MALNHEGAASNILRKHKASLLFYALLLLNLLLISIDTRSQDGRILLKVWTLNALSPAIKAWGLAQRGAQSFWDRYTALSRTYDENVALKKELAKLRLEAQRNAALAAASERLAALLEIKRALPYPSTGALVLLRSPSFFNHTILIDKGINQGVRVDAAVLTSDGIVGRVVTSSSVSAEVQLITSPSAAAAARILETGVEGVINGTGEAMLQLNYVPNHETVLTGQTVVTSGLDGIYPEGLLIGRVVAAKNAFTGFKEVKVRPSLDLHRLREVLVVLK